MDVGLELGKILQQKHQQHPVLSGNRWKQFIQRSQECVIVAVHRILRGQFDDGLVQREGKQRLWKISEEQFEDAC